MCYVIVTTRTLLWTMLTISATLGILAAVVTPRWLVGPPRSFLSRNRQTVAKDALNITSTTPFPEVDSHSYETILNGKSKDSTYKPTLGIFNRCTRIHNLHSFQYSCAPFNTDFSSSNDEFPGFWKASLVFFSIGLIIMVFTVGSSIIGCCVRAIFKKSIFTLSGTAQAVAGLFYIFGLVFYPAGWNSKRVHLVCGNEADYYMTGDCSLGWAFYLALASTLVTFTCAVISIYADSSTSSDKVQDEIFEGKNLICLL